MKFNYIIILILNILLTCSCNTIAKDEKVINENDKILEVAGKYIIQHYPDSADVLKLKPLISDKNEYWEVTYELPELTLGGVPVLYISKDTLEVIKALHYQ